MPHNMGFAAGVNKGIECSRGDYVLVVNPDLVIGLDCVDALAVFLAENEDVGAVGPQLCNPSGEVLPSRRRFPTVRGILTNRFAFMRNVVGHGARRYYLMLDEPFDRPTEVAWLCGGCIMLKRAALEDVGVLDDGFFMYFEDTDWSYRARKRGWKTFYLPRQRAIHDWCRESAMGLNKLFLFHIASMFRFYAKHGLRI